MPRPNRALVTGAGGFIGSALVRHLADAGWEVIAADHHGCTEPGVTAMTLDVATRGALAKVLTPGTIVFHLAASANVAASVRDPRHDLTNTFEGLFEVLETARTVGCPVIFPSTASVFDPAESLPLHERAFPRPTSPYGAAKLAGEAYCYAYHRSYGADVRVARLFSVYGVGMRRYAIHDLIRKIQKQPDEIEILGDGTQVRDYLYIDDAVRGLVTIATNGASGEDYNLAYGAPVRIDELARLIATLMGYPDIRLRYAGKSFPGDTSRWYADVTKVRSLGFTTQVSLEQGLQRTIAWMTDPASRSSEAPPA